MGIHYDYKSKRGERAMLKEAKRKARLAQRRAKRLISSEPLEKEEVKTHDIKKTITLDDLTNPNQKKKWMSISLKKEKKRERIELALKKNLKKRKLFQNKIKNKIRNTK